MKIVDCSIQQRDSAATAKATVRDMERPNLTIALDERNDRLLTDGAARAVSTAAGLMLVGFLAAYVSLVYLHDLILAAERTAFHRM